MTIAEKREAMGLTQKQLAEEFGVCPSAWSRYENGSRQWPAELRAKVLIRLKMAPAIAGVGAWTWAQHRQFARMDQWAGRGQLTEKSSRPGLRPQIAAS